MLFRPVRRFVSGYAPTKEGLKKHGSESTFSEAGQHEVARPQRLRPISAVCVFLARSPDLLRADDPPELGLDRAPESLQTIGALPLQVAANRLDAVRTGRFHHQPPVAEIVDVAEEAGLPIIAALVAFVVAAWEGQKSRL